jgi:peptidoglycan/xylan/chitin deacetylase (PgdA/CDA1 family)
MIRLDRLVTIGIVQPLLGGAGHGENRRRTLPILMYHSVANDVETDISAYYQTVTTPSQFTKQLDFLHAEGWQGVNLTDGLNALRETNVRSAENQKCFVLTFDDGFRDFYTTAWPSLQQFGFSATIYLSTRFISNGPARFQLHGRDCLTWSEVRELFNAGVEVGSHTVSHAKLKELPWNEIESEIFLSKYEIEERLNNPVTSFAYPYAFPQANKRFAQRFQDILRSAGYSTCVTTEIGSVSPHDNPYRLRRLPVNDADDSALLGAKLEGAYNWLAWPQRTVKSLKAILPR